MDVPEHPLPCGHVLCTACVKAYGTQAKSTVSLPYCPLHREATRWAKPALIKFKPAGAGVRVLALDGGGIRGIVQLEVLRAIELSIGGYLPIQSFFDLIVGTGTGGMLGVALSLKDRTVDSCIDMFCALCDHAFTPRLHVPLINQLAHVFGSGSKYKTKPLYEALKTTFGEEDDLFGFSSHLRNGSRVALTSTSVTGREQMLLASYRRPEDILPAYSFERPHEPEMELKVWESVAAALATPSYFRPFNFHSKTYLDGSLRCANPAFIADRERRLIWPDVGEPDLFLSLGTGQNRITVLQKLSERLKDSAASTIPKPGETTTKARKVFGRWRSRRIDDVVDAEVAWADFRQYAVRDRSEARSRRFIRFNPDLDREPPAPDSRSEMESLQANVRKRLQAPERLAALRNVAHRLVASSFYFDMQTKAIAHKSEQVCTGSIACRFDDGSVEMCALGRVLKEQRREDFEPYFLIRPDMEQSDSAFKVTVAKDIIGEMTDGAVFGLPNISIPLRDETKPTSITLFLSPHDGLEPDGFLISGFPRVLVGEPKATHTRKPPRPSMDTLREPSRPSMDTWREPLQRPATKGSSEADTVSLNGPAGLGKSSNSSEDSWQETQSRLSSTVSRLSLGECIALSHQSTGSNLRGKTNRFWTYIGNNHMAQHPELHSADEIAKFTTSSVPIAPDVALSTESAGHAGIWRPELPESDFSDSVMRELRAKQQSPGRSHPFKTRPAIPIIYESECGAGSDDTESMYSGHEVQVAQARPMTQVRRTRIVGLAFIPNSVPCW